MQLCKGIFSFSWERYIYPSHSRSLRLQHLVISCKYAQAEPGTVWKKSHGLARVFFFSLIKRNYMSLTEIKWTKSDLFLKLTCSTFTLKGNIRLFGPKELEMSVKLEMISLKQKMYTFSVEKLFRALYTSPWAMWRVKAQDYVKKRQWEETGSSSGL